MRLKELHGGRACADEELEVFVNECCACFNEKDRGDVRNDVAC